MSKLLFMVAVLSIIVLAGGCQSRESREPRESYSERTGKAIEDAAPSRRVELIDSAGLRKLMSERRGNVLLLNIWATWCSPCVEELPDLVRLSRSYGHAPVEIVGISVDYPDEIDSKVIPFLDSTSVPFKMYVAKFDKQEDFINALSTSWSGAVPATFIYDSEGKRRLSLVGQRTYTQFKRAVDKVIATM